MGYRHSIYIWNTGIPDTYAVVWWVVINKGESKRETKRDGQRRKQSWTEKRKGERIET
jgi:hypothetical protein